MSAPKPRELMGKKAPHVDEATLLLMGVVAMLLACILYIKLGFAPDISPSE